jgi:hypothetical protein
VSDVYVWDVNVKYVSDNEVRARLDFAAGGARDRIGMGPECVLSALSGPLHCRINMLATDRESPNKRGHQMALAGPSSNLRSR